MAEWFEAKYSTEDVVAIMCVDTAAEDEESDYSDNLVCAEEVTASTQQEDKTGSCSDLLLASSPDSSLPSEESSIDEPDSSL